MDAWRAGREFRSVFWNVAVFRARLLLLLSGGLAVAGAVLTALGPVALKVIIDRLADGRGHNSLTLRLMVLGYLLALLLARVCNELRGLSFALAEQRIIRTLGERLFWHLMHLPLRFHLDRRAGSVNQIIDNGLQGVRMILRYLMFTYIPVAIELATAMAVLVRTVATAFLLIFCASVICYAAAFGCFTASMTRRARVVSSARVEVSSVLTDILLNYETVKVFAAEAFVQRAVIRVLRAAEVAWVRFYRGYAMSGIAVAGVFVAATGCMVVYSTEKVLSGDMTLGGFVLVMTYMFQAVQPVEMVGQATQGMSQGVALFESVVEMFREPMERDGGGRCGAMVGRVQFQDVSVSYGGERRVLDGVTFSVAAGKILAIVGPSGSGKSTIARLMTRLVEPETGEVLFDGVPVAQMALQDLRRLIAVVPQEAAIFNGTIGYNIGMARDGATAEEMRAAAEVAQLHEFIMTLPDRYDTVVGERGMQLSGGERQRIAIARAVLRSPAVYIFDEATSSLDSTTERKLLSSLRAVCRRNTTLLIAHRLSTVVGADEIMVLENGRVAERGSHQALLRGKGRYSALWMAQRGSGEDGSGNGSGGRGTSDGAVG